MEKVLEGEVARSEMVEESAEYFNVHSVNRRANFESSQFKGSKMARKGNELTPVVLSSFIWTSAYLREGGKVSVRMKAEGKFEEAAIDLIDTEAFQIQGNSMVADQKSQTNYTDDDSSTLLNVKICEEIFYLHQQTEIQQRLEEGWTRERMILSFVEREFKVIWPQVQDAKEKDIISSSDQSKFQQFKSEFSYDEDNVDPYLISAIVQTDQGQSNFRFGIKGFKRLTVARSSGGGKQSSICEGGSTRSTSGGDDYSQSQKTCFIRKFGYLNFRFDDFPDQIFQEMYRMGEQSSTMRGDTSSVAGGGSQRFRWAAKESAPNEF